MKATRGLGLSNTPTSLTQLHKPVRTPLSAVYHDEDAEQISTASKKPKEIS